MVVSIMALLASPSLLSIAAQGGQSFTSQIYDLQATLSLVRTAAMAKNTFVWAGIGEGKVDGKDAMIVVAYASQDGLNDVTADNLAPIMKDRIFPGLGMMPITRVLTGQDPGGTDLHTTSANWSLPNPTVAGAVVPLTQAILFSPTGEAFLASTPLSYIEIGLQPLHGAVASGGNNFAALQISGIASQMEVFRN